MSSWISRSRTAVGDWYKNSGWVRRRIYLIIIAVVVAWAITGTVIFIVSAWATNHRDDLFVGILSAWSGELLFFTILGLLVSVVTLRDPAKEVYDERIRILFGKGPDSVLNYNKRALMRLAAYAHGSRSIVIEEYDEAHNAYKTRIKTTYRYRNLLHDVDYEDTLPWNINPDQFEANAPNELGRIISISVSGNETIKTPQLITATGFTTELSLYIKRGEETAVVFEYILLFKIGEIQALVPQRFVEEFTMTIVNQTSVLPTISFDGDQGAPVSLLYNQKVSLKPVQGVSPGEKIFVFKLLAPSSGA